jgi:hypothetical protein
MTEQISSQILLDKKAELQAQVKAAHFLLVGEADEPQIAQDVLALREQQAKMESQVAYLNTTLNRLNGQIPALANGQHKMLLQAITAQRWYAIKNIPEVLYDSETGYLLPSFDYGFELTKKLPNNFSLGGIKPGKWNDNCVPFASIKNKITADNGKLQNFFKTYPCKNKLASKTIFLGHGVYNGHEPVAIFSNNYNYVNLVNNVITPSDNDEGSPLPICQFHYDARIHPPRDNFKANERAQIILDFFLEQNWEPVFDQPEYEKIYQIIQQHPQLLKELAELDDKIEDALKYEATLHQPLSGQFDFLIDLQKYNPAEIDRSSLKYSLSLHQWAGQLLSKIDEFSRNNHELIQRATTLHQRLHQNQKISRFEHIGNSSQILVDRDEVIKNSLRFGLDKVRSKLINAQQRAKELQKRLDESALNSEFLADLAGIQNAPRPDFIFIAEYTAQIVLKEILHLEWLEAHQSELEALVESHLKGIESFNVFTSKDRDDFMRAAKHEEIEIEVATGWFDAWVRQRLIIEQQILPLYEMAFGQQCPLNTVNEVLAILHDYQLAIDKFYKEENHVIYRHWFSLTNLQHIEFMRSLDLIFAF